MRINSYIPINGQWQIISIFGYSSKSIPGLEIKGLGAYGMILKEKIVYLSKANNLRLPLKKFVLCVDLPSNAKKDRASIAWLDLPVLIIFWKMLGFLPLGKLEDCFAAGVIKTNGKIIPLRMNEEAMLKLQLHLEKNYNLSAKFFLSQQSKKTRGINMIPLEQIFHKNYMEIKSLR